eukprot:CAMPEP_0181505836 /NCGR_PEP_ID=MMETSP1110-20121109/58271_1 /TAXON_ID=174948 /ORGANISM="Symbiodinium sp., Strain CCMP421" /LENGTH=89 /DNA_ID=CAMNT_0023634849 /DNA_START=183 /DNA_END=450 /DNA_ORIENTATION=-
MQLWQIDTESWGHMALASFAHCEVMHFAHAAPTSMSVMLNCWQVSWQSALQRQSRSLLAQAALLRDPNDRSPSEEAEPEPAKQHTASAL